MIQFQISDGTSLAVDPQLLRDSFIRVANYGPDAVNNVRDYLFSKFPETEPLFADIDINQHNVGWIKTLSFVTENLENEIEMRKYLFDLGLRHVKYGAEAWYYDWVGSAMINGFAILLAESWDQALANEWCKLYVIMKSMMMDGHNSTLPEAERTKVWAAETLNSVSDHF
jgi:hemoglobin-like flavoprotein